MKQTETYYCEAVELLKRLISTPSISREEDGTAKAIEEHFTENNIIFDRYLNNVVAKNLFFDPAKPTLLLNSHHDTVPPNRSYKLDPFTPLEENGRLYGLGSNDAGGSLVSLIQTFIHFYAQENLSFNIVLAATAEEEISGTNGVEALISRLPEIDCAIVGEPTLMQMAVSERGLMVVDCVAHGLAGHAARNEGVNAIYEAMKDIEWIREHQFEKISDTLGAVKMSVTSIETDNKAHNIVPSSCRFLIDIRLNEHYSMEDVIATLQKNLQSEIRPRSTRLKSTAISTSHPLIRAGYALGRTSYGSPTTSDKALMPWPTLKMGPGDSARSHTADEFIYLDEIRQGIELYISIIEEMMNSPKS